MFIDFFIYLNKICLFLEFLFGLKKNLFSKLMNVVCKKYLIPIIVDLDLIWINLKHNYRSLKVLILISFETHLQKLIQKFSNDTEKKWWYIPSPQTNFEFGLIAGMIVITTIRWWSLFHFFRGSGCGWCNWSKSSVECKNRRSFFVVDGILERKN